MRNHMIAALPPPGDDTLPATLARTIAAHGHRDAFVAPGERLTWEALGAATGRTAAALARVGVRAGDHVGILMENRAAWVTTFFAAATLGAVTVPVSTRLRRDEIAYCLRHADVSTLVTVPRFLGIDFAGLLLEVEPALGSQLPGSSLPRLERVVMVDPRDTPAEPPCPAGAVRLSDVRIDETDPPASSVGPDDLLLIQYTSGTTSRPKGVMLTHRNMLSNAAAVAERMGVRPDDRYFSIRPYFHVAGTTLSLLVALTTGACLLTLPTFDVERSLRCLVDERCTLTSGNDTIFLMLMGHPAFDPASLALRGGWAAAGPEVMARIHDVMGVRGICYAYGLSEASPNVVMSSWQDSREDRVAGLASPHPGTALRICDPDAGRDVPVGGVGEIQVRGWSVMRGYYNMPEATAEAITPDGWLRTGDAGSLDGRGRLRLVGRLKDIIRVGGENVAPADIEEVLHAHPAVGLAQVVGVPDDRLIEVPAAYVQLKPGAVATADELLAWCRNRCAAFKVPRYLRLVDTFDAIGMTASSKVQKAKLRAYAVIDLGLAVRPRGDAPTPDRTQRA